MKVDDDRRLDLFADSAQAGPGSGPGPGRPGAARRGPGAGRSRPGGNPEGHRAPGGAEPLAARLRPRTLDEVVGQAHILGEGRALRELIARDEVPSMILWGPPGSGKTTLGRVIAHGTRSAFAPFSAVSEGVPRIRQIVAEAEARARATGRRTILFVDEIHRLNRAQQDALLPHVEAGTFTLIGATTENPSFEVIGALLSRSRVFVLEPLGDDELESLLRRALADAERGLGAGELDAREPALRLLAELSDGDARRALNGLEVAASLAGPRGRIDEAVIREAMQHRHGRYDRAGDQHYDLISALHKSVRGGDPDGALYWLARMLEGGEDPLYLARRLIRMAVEDIGLADAGALRLALAARDAYHFLGSPEGDLALAQAAVYLAAAPKSNRVYAAFSAARAAARESPAAPVPLHLRNAPTELMRTLGYGREYRYAFDSPEHFIPQSYLPDALADARFYDPSRFGSEGAISARLAGWRDMTRGAGDRDEEEGGDARASEDERGEQTSSERGNNRNGETGPGRLTEGGAKLPGQESERR